MSEQLTFYLFKYTEQLTFYLFTTTFKALPPSPPTSHSSFQTLSPVFASSRFIQVVAGFQGAQQSSKWNPQIRTVPAGSGPALPQRPARRGCSQHQPGYLLGAYFCSQFSSRSVFFGPELSKVPKPPFSSKHLCYSRSWRLFCVQPSFCE